MCVDTRPASAATARAGTTRTGTAKPLTSPPRTGKRRFPKASLVVDCRSHLVLALHAGRGPTPDVDELAALLGELPSSITLHHLLLAAAKRVLDEHRQNGFLPISVRQIHYHLLNDPPLRHAGKPGSTYRNNPESTKNLSNLLTRHASPVTSSWMTFRTRRARSPSGRRTRIAARSTALGSALWTQHPHIRMLPRGGKSKK